MLSSIAAALLVCAGFPAPLDFHLSKNRRRTSESSQLLFTIIAKQTLTRIKDLVLSGTGHGRVFQLQLKAVAIVIIVNPTRPRLWLVEIRNFEAGAPMGLGELS